MGRRPATDSRWQARQAALAGLFFAAAAVLFTWPLAAHVNDGMVDIWDGKLNAWIFHWDYHQIFRDPLRLFDANIFYPARYALAFSENLFGAAVFGFPLYALGASTLPVGNLLLLAGMALSGLAGWALAREVTGDPAASLLGGVIYAFVPWRLAQLPHVQFQWGAFLALLLLFILRYLRGGRRRDAFLFSLFFAWNALTNVHYAIFSGFLVLLVLCHAFAVLPEPVFRHRIRGIAMALAVAGLAVTPFYIPYARAASLYGMQRLEGEIAFFSARPIDFFTAGPENKLYAPLQKFAHPEGDLFPGLVPLALAAVAIATLRRRAASPDPRNASRGGARVARVLDVLIMAGVILWAVLLIRGRPSLGPLRVRDPGRTLFFVALLLVARSVVAFPRRSRFASLGDFARRTRIGSRALLFLAIGALGVFVAFGTRNPVYRFLVQSAGPALRAIRVPERGIVLSHLGLAVLASWGLAMWPRRSRGWAILAALLLTTIEYRAFPVGIHPVSSDPPPVYRWLAAAPFSRAAVEWPVITDIEPEHVFRSTAHWKPILNGYSGFAPPPYLRMQALLAGESVDERVWGTMRELGASVLLFHPSESTDDERRKYLTAVRLGIAGGKIVPLASFPRKGASSRDYAFRLAGAAAFALPKAGEPVPSRETVLREITDLELKLADPIARVERPREGEAITRGYWAFGWALDDSGVARVVLSAPGAPPVECLSGQPFPGVAAVYPKLPEGDRAGFGCPLPALASGPQILTFTITARDGGVLIVRRPVRVE